MNLEGKVALVTGGSRGIGRGIAEALAAEGAAVAVNYRSSKGGADEVVEAIKAAGGSAVAVQGDVADYDDAEAMVKQTIAELGGLHILVNNAGISKDALIFNMEPERLARRDAHRTSAASSTAPRPRSATSWASATA